MTLKPEPCSRCSQPTRYFWKGDDGSLSPWCNFCVTAQVVSFIGAVRFQGFVTVFTRAIDSGAEDDFRSITLALRALSTLIHDADDSSNSQSD